jgi:hypothetical protein
VCDLKNQLTGCTFKERMKEEKKERDAILHSQPNKTKHTCKDNELHGKHLYSFHQEGH